MDVGGAKAFKYSIVSLNTWGEHERTTQRKKALVRFISTFTPDIVALQEHTCFTNSCIAEAMDVGGDGCVSVNQLYDWVQEDGANPAVGDDGKRFDNQRNPTGWRQESNIYWNKHLFEKVDHGCLDVGIVEEFRGLFWVRLRVRETAEDLLIATAHLTWQGSRADQNENDIDPRRNQMRQCADALKSHERLHDIPLIFTGDFNCGWFPPKIFKEEMPHMENCFTGLNMPYQVTHPCRPTGSAEEDTCIDQVLDWIFYDTRSIRPLAASIPKTMVDGKQQAISDHMPILFMFQLE